jgi:hypothetical protein
MTTICRHIKTNGQRCGCPALRDHAFCYFHRTIALSHPKPAPEPPTILHPLDGRDPQVASQPTLNLPPLEDREAIQLATSMVIGALARNTLDTKRAVTLLYGLQVASANARNLSPLPDRGYLVTETTITSTGEEIAPDADPEAEILYQNFLRSLEHDEQDDDEDDELDEAEPTARVTTARYPFHGE